MPEQYRLVPVDGKTMLDAFIRVPWRIYRDDPQWVPPLILERRDALSSKHPYFSHAEWQPWIAYRDGEAVGRISAQIDRLHLERHEDGAGFFGMIEGLDDPELFRVLTDTAENWLRERGMTRIRGPFNLSINQEAGLLVEGFDTPPFILMAHARPYYGERLEAAGYRGCQDLLSYVTPADFELPKLFARQIRKLRKEVTIRPLDRSRKREELGVIRDIFNDAWSENWGFVPFTDAEFAKAGAELMYLVPEDMALIAEHEGRPAAFIVAVPNLNEAIMDLDGRLFPFGWAKLLWRLKVKFPATTRVPLMGVRKAYHHTALGPSMAMALTESVRINGQRRGTRTAETSWILESNAGMRKIMEHVGGTISKRYRIYEKAL